MIQQQLVQQPGQVVMMPSNAQITVQPGQSGGYGTRPVAWEYPVKGMCHFLSHPSLWLYALCPFVCSFFALIFASGLVASTFDSQHDFVSAPQLILPSVDTVFWG